MLAAFEAKADPENREVHTFVGQVLEASYHLSLFPLRGKRHERAA